MSNNLDMMGTVTVDLENNIIKLHDDIDNKSVATVINGIIAINNEYSKTIENKTMQLSTLGINEEQIVDILSKEDIEPIYLYIDTRGGSLGDTIALINTMKKSQLPIITIVDGYAYSAGFLIFIHGDFRILSPDADLMYHQFSTINFGTHTEILDSTEQNIRIANKYRRMITEQTDITLEQLEIWDRENRNVYFELEDAIRYGICDDVEEINKELADEINKLLKIAESEVEEVVENGK